MKAPAFLLLIGLALAATVSASDPPRSETRGIISHIKRTAVVSSALASIGYSKRLHALEIEFVNGAIYRYQNVPLSVYRQLLSAESKTRFYHMNIRGKFRSVHVRPRPKNPGDSE